MQIKILINKVIHKSVNNVDNVVKVCYILKLKKFKFRII